MSYFKYRGKSVYYEEYGQGTPLVFLHGNTASSKMSERLNMLYFFFQAEDSPLSFLILKKKRIYHL